MRLCCSIYLHVLIRLFRTNNQINHNVITKEFFDALQRLQWQQHLLDDIVVQLNNTFLTLTTLNVIIVSGSPWTRQIVTNYTFSWFCDEIDPKLDELCGTISTSIYRQQNRSIQIKRKYTNNELIANYYSKNENEKKHPFRDFKTVIINVSTMSLYEMVLTITNNTRTTAIKKKIELELDQSAMNWTDFPYLISVCGQNLVIKHHFPL